MGNDDVERFLEYVYVNASMLHKGFMESLDRALDMLGKGSELSGKMANARNMAACGEDVDSAIARQLMAGRIGARARLRYVHILAYLGGRDTRLGIADVHREIVTSSNARLRIAYGSMQKYLTANMLFSTILPSMAMFGFVGYSLIDYSNMVMLTFLFALLAAMPAAYALIQDKIRSLNA